MEQPAAATPPGKATRPGPTHFHAKGIVVKRLLILTCALGFACSSAGPASGDEVEIPPLYEDVPAPWQPKRPRSESASDQLNASALFAEGRLLVRRQNFLEGLRRYQRAWRLDPSDTILQEIVPLAFAIGRRDEAARYALLAAETDVEHPALLPVLTQLGVHLTQQEDWQNAIPLYRKVLELQQGEPSADVRVALSLEIGRLHFLAGEFEQAAKAFEKFLAAMDDPQKHGISQEVLDRLLENDEVTFRLIGESFLRAGKLDKAEDHFAKAYADDEELLALQRARIAAARGQTDTALEQLQPYLTSGSSETGLEPYRLLQKLLKKKHGDEEVAARELIQQLHSIHDAHPENAALALFLGQLLLEQEQWEKAEAVYREMVDQSPTIEGYQGLVTVYREQDQYRELLDILGRVAAQTRDLNVLGETIEALVGDDDFMAQLWERDLLENWKGKADRWAASLALAQLAVEQQDWERAGKYFQAAMEAPGAPSSELLISWGLALLMGDRYSEAAETFQRALNDASLAQRSHAIYFYLATALQMADRPDEAARAARRAVALKPDVPEYYNRLGWVLYQADDYEAAEKAYEQLIERFDTEDQSPETRELLRNTRLALSGLHVERGNLSEAEERLEQVLDEYPTHIGALNDLGYLWADQSKHLQRALGMIQKAVAADPDNEAYRDSLGWAYYQLGRYDEAAEELEKATAGEEPDGVILDHLGDVYWKLDRTDEAVESWQRAIESLQKHDEPARLGEIQEKIRKAQQPQEDSSGG